MPLPEYMDWQRYDAVEPLSITMALDRLFARLLRMTAKDYDGDTDEWRTFDTLTMAERSKRAVERFKRTFENK